MQINHDDLAAAVKAGVINPKQADDLWVFWQQTHENVPSFRLTHVMYYFGGLLAISAVTLFVTQAWEQLRGIPLFIISLALFVLGLALTNFFMQKKLSIPAGIMSTFSLAIVPLAVYNLQYWLGYLPDVHLIYNDYHSWVNWYWVPMELATLLVGVVMLYFFQFPFLLFPISVTLWYMSMDLIPILFNSDRFTWEDRADFSLYFGIIFILIAIYVDIRNTHKHKDFAFWLYIFGVLTFWGGLSCQEPTNELGRFIYCLINIFMILLSVFLNRRVFAIFGALGILGYLGHLAYTVFADSLLFPIALVFLGLIIILGAAKWSHLEAKLNNYLEPYIPSAFSKRRRS